jgi:DNA-binding transcriptional MerR regulator
MNADEFSAEIGLTARTIRSYHTRGLLPPPVRIGRAPHYSADHLSRMRQVLYLQRCGLSLDAVAALLEPDMVLSQVMPVKAAVTEALRGRPELLAESVEGGIVSYREDGAVEVHAVRAVLAAGGRSTSAAGALALLAELAAAIAPHADNALDIVRRTVARSPLANSVNNQTLIDLVVEVLRARIRQVGVRSKPEHHSAGRPRREPGPVPGVTRSPGTSTRHVTRTDGPAAFCG